MLFPLTTYKEIDSKLPERAVYSKSKIVPVSVPTVDDSVLSIANKQDGAGVEKFIVWSALNTMFQGLHRDNWVVANACIYGLLGEQVMATILDTPPLEAMSIFVGYSDLIAAEAGFDPSLEDEVKNFMAAACLMNGEVLMPKNMEFASDEEALRVFRLNSAKDFISDSNTRVAAIQRFVDSVISADIARIS